jgi:alpha-beta hydrolase superfamily lysophospholipase
MNRKRILIIAACAVVFTAALWALCGPERTGLARFYKDQPYHFNTLRAMGEIPFGGGEAAEILAAIKNIPQGDDERWYVEWEKAGARVEKTARSYKNQVSRGHALLRAHSYYRTAEFFLHPKDPRRPVSFDKNKRAFYDGLKALGITHRIIAVPYGAHTLKAVYYPAANPDPKKPLILACGGYDSTLEELYFMIVDGALKRGYSCLTFEGPGQGSIIREQGLQFTHEWEKPTGPVLDRFLGMYPSPRAIVFIGASLGGYLAPRAAAFDRRIDGVAAYGVCYDFQEAALMQVPGFVRFLHRNGFIGTVNALITLKMKNTPGVRWGVRNAQWTMGAKDPADLLNIFSRYTLKDVAARINCHVLILAGERDHFFPVHQVDQFKKALVNARSVTARIFTEEEGGHEHCQVGALNLFHGVFFDWVAGTFEK